VVEVVEAAAVVAAALATGILTVKEGGLAVHLRLEILEVAMVEGRQHQAIGDPPSPVPSI
jgi:hypothetical protein